MSPRSNYCARSARRLSRRSPSVAGEVVKRLGDGLMAVFWDAASATEAAFAAAARASAIEAHGYVPRLAPDPPRRPRKIGGDYFGVESTSPRDLRKPPPPARSWSRTEP